MLIYEVSTTPEGKPFTITEITKRAGSNVINPNEYRLYSGQFEDTGDIKSGTWFSNDKNVLAEIPDGEWKFVSREVIEGSESKDYKTQTDFLIEYWKQNIFKQNASIFNLINTNPTIPIEYAQAFAEWEGKKDSLVTAEDFANQPVSKLLRESFASTVFRYISLQKSKNKKILKDKYSWSGSTSSDGDLLSFGDATADGAGVGWGRPGFSSGVLGVVFSRMKILELEK